MLVRKEHPWARNLKKKNRKGICFVCKGSITLTSHNINPPIPTSPHRQLSPSLIAPPSLSSLGKLEILLSSHVPARCHNRSLPGSSPRPPGWQCGSGRAARLGTFFLGRLGAAVQAIAAMQSPRRNAEGRPLGTCDPSSSGSPAHGGGSRFEFSPAQQPRAGHRPHQRRLRSSESPVHPPRFVPLGWGGLPQTLPAPTPEEDRIDLNPSFLGIALRSLLAIDLWLSKKLGCAGRARPGTT